VGRAIENEPQCDFGRAIDKVRAAHGWNLTEFARFARCTQGEVTKYRAGSAKAKPGRLVAWESVPALAPHVAAFKAAIASDIAAGRERAARRARARELPASGKPPHVVEALAAVEAILMRSAPGSWIGGWIEHLELEARKHPLPHRANGTGPA